MLASVVPERRREGIITAVLLVIVSVGLSLIENLILVLLVKELAARIMVSGHRVDLEVLIKVFAGACRPVIITRLALVHLGLERGCGRPDQRFSAVVAASGQTYRGASFLLLLLRIVLRILGW